LDDFSGAGRPIASINHFSQAKCALQRLGSWADRCAGARAGDPQRRGRAGV